MRAPHVPGHRCKAATPIIAGKTVFDAYWDGSLMNMQIWLRSRNARTRIGIHERPSQRQMAKVVNTNTASEYAYIADGGSLWHRLSALARSSPDAALRPREKALMPVIALCSLGLWWAIWLAVAHLALPWLW